MVYSCCHLAGRATAITIAAVSLNACMSRKSTISLSGLNMDGLLTYSKNSSFTESAKGPFLRFREWTNKMFRHLFPVLSSVQSSHYRPVLPAGPDDGVADGADPAQVGSHAAVLGPDSIDKKVLEKLFEILFYSVTCLEFPFLNFFLVSVRNLKPKLM